LRSLPGFGTFEYDFTAAPEARGAAVERAMKLWQSRPAHRGGASLPLDASGRIDRAAVSAALARRDDRPVTISE